MEKKKFLSLMLAVFMLLSVFMPMSFADGGPFDGITDGELSEYVTASVLLDIGEDAIVKSGEVVNAYLALDWNLYYYEPVFATVTVETIGSLKFAPPSASGANYAYSFDLNNPNKLEITVQLPTTMGHSETKIPINIIFPNGVTPNGEAGAVYISKFESGNYSYSTNFDKNTLTGSSVWIPGTANKEFYSTISAISGIDWKYSTGKNGSSVTIPASDEKIDGNNPSVEYSVPKDPSFGFKLNTTNKLAGKQTELMYTRSTTPAAIIEVVGAPTADIALEASYFQLNTGDKLEALGDGRFIWYWNATNTNSDTSDLSPAEHSILIKKIKYFKDEFKDATIKMTPVVYDAAADTISYDAGKGCYTSKDYGCVTAINGKPYAIAESDAMTLTVNKTPNVIDDEGHESDTEVSVTKTRQSWKYDLTDGSKNWGADGAYTRDFVTKDILFWSDSGPDSGNGVYHGDRIWFALNFENNTSRNVLPEVKLTEIAEDGSTGLGKTTSFNTNEMNIIGFDPGSYENSGGMELTVKVTYSDTSETKYPFTSANGSMSGNTAQTDKDKKVSKLEFVYSNVPKTMEISKIKPPRILFEAKEQSSNMIFNNTVFMQVTPYGDAGKNDDIKKDDPAKNDAADPMKSTASVQYKLNGTTTGSTKTARIGTGANLGNGAAILAGGKITYTIQITNNGNSATENIGRVLIKDLFDSKDLQMIGQDYATAFDTGDADFLSNVTLTVKTKDGNSDALKPATAGYEDSYDSRSKTYTYKDVTLNTFTAVDPAEGTDRINNGLGSGEAGFYLWLEGNFLPGDVISLTFDAKTKDSLPTGFNVLNKYTYMLVPKYIGENEKPIGPGGGSSSPDGWSSGGQINLKIRDKEVKAGIKKTVVDDSGKVAATTYYVKDNDGPTENKIDDKIVTYTYKNDNISSMRYQITATLATDCDMGGLAPVIVDQLPSGFTLEDLSKDDGFTNLTVHYKAKSDASESLVNSQFYDASRAEDASKTNFLVIKMKKNAFKEEEMKPGDSLIVRFNAKPPTHITFGKDPNAYIKYTNLVYFDPNGRNAIGTGEHSRQIAGFVKLTEGSQTLYKDASLIPETVKTSITGASDFDKDISDKTDKRFIYASMDVTFKKSQPIVSLTKNAYTDLKPETAVSDDNRLIAGKKVYYKAVFANRAETGASGDITIKNIVDMLPEGQSYTGADTVEIKKNDAKIPQTITATPGIDNSRRVRFSLSEPVTLTQGDSITIAYSATVAGDIKELVIDADKKKTAYYNEIAVYPKESIFNEYAGTTSAAYPQQEDNSAFYLGADDASHGEKYVYAKARIYYDVERIHPDIQKDVYTFVSGQGAGTGWIQWTEQMPAVNFNRPQNVQWRIRIENAKVSGANNATMTNYKIYDPLHNGVTMTTAQLDKLREQTGVKNKFTVEYDGNTNLLIFTANKSDKPAQNADLAPGAAIEIIYETEVSEGAAMARIVKNSAYLVPNAAQYFTPQDTEKGALLTEHGKYTDYDSLPAVEAADQIKFTSPISAVSRKYVKRQNGEIIAYSGEPAIDIDRGETVTYGFELDNISDSKSFERFAMIDILPRENDSYIILNRKRDSKWKPYLPSDPNFRLEKKPSNGTGGKIEYKIYVSTDRFNSVSDIDWDKGWDEKITDTRWTLIDDSVWNKDFNTEDARKSITAIMVFTDTALERGCTYEFTWDMKVPNDIYSAPNGKIAWNSAAYGVWARFGESTRFNAEPDKVGIRPAGSFGDLDVVKELTNPQYFEGMDVFTFSLYDADDKSKTPKGIKKTDNPNIYEYDSEGSNKTFRITVPENGAPGTVTIKDLPEGHYIIEEIDLNESKYKTDVAYVYSGPMIDDNTENGQMTDVYVYSNATVKGLPSAVVTVRNTAVLPYSLLVEKHIVNHEYSVNRNFDFKLYTRIKDSDSWLPVRLKKQGDTLKFVESGEGGDEIFTIHVDESGPIGSVLITDLPKRNYRVVELTDGYEKTYAYYAYNAGAANPKEGTEGLFVSGNFDIHKAKITNYVSRPLVVEKTIKNRSYTSVTDFKFRLLTKNGAHRNPVSLIPAEGKSNVYTYAPNAADSAESFVIHVPSDRAVERVQIEALPTGEYLVEEVTQGFSETYAYSYVYTADTANPKPAGDGLRIDQRSLDIAYYLAKVTNNVSKGGGTPSIPDKPTVPTVPDKPTVPTVPPDDGGGSVTPPVTPGGNDPASPPRPTLPGNSLTPAGNGVYIEIGDDGTPLGEWRYDVPTEQWIFDEYPPLANLPQTGFRGEFEETGRTVYPFICLITLLLLIVAVMPPVSARRKNSRDAQK